MKLYIIIAGLFSATLVKAATYTIDFNSNEAALNCQDNDIKYITKVSDENKVTGTQLILTNSKDCNPVIITQFVEAFLFFTTIEMRNQEEQQQAGETTTLLPATTHDSTHEDGEKKDYKYYCIWLWRFCIFAVTGSLSVHITKFVLDLLGCPMEVLLFGGL
ncbi:hypothetical protein [Parasitella parasitica]|uniref:Autophagy-related protein n=1 Tax=Parasitella parasitica TaxID=35722 RepID=A0A0B7MQ79_9FUNG|nr:hypothetical protein [Parasitella parasitica]